MLSRREFEEVLYSRHTKAVQEKLGSARVCIIGLGGLGSNIAISLARIGIGCLHLIDFDVVEPSNLNRQQYQMKHLDLPKTEALSQVLRDINPYVELIVDDIKVTEDNVEMLLKEDTFICEAVDNPEAKAMIVSKILEHMLEKIVVAASGMAGYGDSNQIQTKQIAKNFYLCGDFVSEVKPGHGLMAPRVAICAGHQANKIVQLILEEKNG